MNSVGTKEDVGMSLELFLDLEAKESLPCEIGGHDGTNSKWHDSGPATWYVYFKCPECGNEGVTSVCDKIMLMLRRFNGIDSIWCISCGEWIEPARSIIREVKA